MTALFHIDGRDYYADLSTGRSIAIPLHFDGPQPNSYDVDQAHAEAVESGGFIGDTRRGGSCNFERMTLIPHCNGTHTECVGHITRARIAVGTVLSPAIMPALLLSVPVTSAAATAECYEPPKSENDVLITATAIVAALAAHGIAVPDSRAYAAQPDPATDAEQNDAPPSHPFLEALLLRTLPNDPGKCTRRYMAEPAAFFSVEAMRLLCRLGVRHLLVDVPSLDRAFDDGHMTAHHIFWDLPAGSHDMGARNASTRTVTEMIFIPDDIPDGRYLLDLQIAAFVSDAAPSRPVLFSLTPVHGGT
ncbi:MAG: cyclase family protein [Bacteroidota bacterium]|jgi:hypothetical protein|nr:cyclase family protein [Bacteroidota bacterium]